MYNDDKTCKETYKALSSGAKVALVDVRTTKEWNTIGVPDLSQISSLAQPNESIAPALFIEWQMFPHMMVNPEFAEITHAKLKDMGLSKEDPVYFLCRSGVRSKGAASAMAALGYTKTYNILGGFEGDPDASGERTHINGWVFDHLPSKNSTTDNATDNSPRTREQRE